MGELWQLVMADTGKVGWSYGLYFLPDLVEDDGMQLLCVLSFFFLNNKKPGSSVSEPNQGQGLLIHYTKNPLSIVNIIQVSSLDPHHIY